MYKSYFSRKAGEDTLFKMGDGERRIRNSLGVDF